MDIVQQLRSIGCNSTQGCATDGKPNNICRCIIQNDAADEIERLRKFIKEHDMAEVLEDWENA